MGLLVVIAFNPMLSAVEVPGVLWLVAGELPTSPELVSTRGGG